MCSVAISWHYLTRAALLSLNTLCNHTFFVLFVFIFWGNVNKSNELTKNGTAACVVTGSLKFIWANYGESLQVVYCWNVQKLCCCCGRDLTVFTFRAALQSVWVNNSKPDWAQRRTSPTRSLAPIFPRESLNWIITCVSVTSPGAGLSPQP